MRFTRIRLENWRNFLSVDVPTQYRVFIAGPNASGKSNFLDSIRFLRDLADPEGGFQSAVQSKRNGVSQLRSLHTRRYPNVVIDVDVDLGNDKKWNYRLEFKQDNQGRPLIEKEVVKLDQKTIVMRPTEDDLSDSSRLSQTYLEQVNSNRDFRPLQDFFSRIRYLHIVPQIIRDPSRSTGISQDPFGGDFLEQVARAQKRIRESRFDKIIKALQVAVPQLERIELQRDTRGVPHLMGLYKHWRPKAGWQQEDQFSDGTLRLLGLLWALLDGSHPLLLEEPELSLHPEVVKQIPLMMARLGRKLGRQIFVSTHSADLLSDSGISAEEVLLLKPSSEDTKILPASDDAQIRALLQGGIPISEAVLPRVAPKDISQLSMFGD